MKRLIVTADDFGYSRNVNKGIIKCFREGIITSTSLIVNTIYFDESVKLLKRNKNLDAGVHINLTEFNPLTKAGTLTDKSGNFVAKAKWIDGHFKNADKNEIEEEIEAQINKAISSSLKITHINGHNHIHIFPNVIGATIKLAKKHKIEYIRLPDEKIIDKKQELSAEIQKRNLMSKFSSSARIKIIKNGIKTVDAFYGILNIDDMDFGKFAMILKSIKNGTSELMAHPSFADRRGSDFHRSGQRETEIRLLTSKKTMQAIKNLKIRLTNFSKL